MKYILIRHNVHVNSLNPLAFISMNASKLKERERENKQSSDNMLVISKYK